MSRYPAGIFLFLLPYDIIISSLSTEESEMGFLDADITVRTILDIPLDRLKDLGIDSLIVDVDNTITEWRGTDIEEKGKNWFLELKEHGFKACLVSNNNNGERISFIAGKLGIPSIHRAGKPSRNAFIRALRILDSTPETTAVVGDQVFTDVLGGNRMGMLTILVDPISTSEFIGTKIMRFVERIISKRNTYK